VKAFRGLDILAFLAAAALCALVANALAPAHRRLAWTGWVPTAEWAPAEAVPAATFSALPAPSAAAAPASPQAGPTGPAPAVPLGSTPSVSPASTHAARPSSSTAAAPATRERGLLPRPARAAAKPAPPSKARWTPDPNTAIRDLTSEDAWAAFQEHLPFLDARRSQDFAEGHVAGARSAPVWETQLDTRITEFEARAMPGPASPIVLYCGGGDCEDSRLLARKLVTLGYRNLLIYRDGYPDWAAKGRPVAKEGRP
jgi:rhodanese-related sulfurtransferase